MVTVQDVVPTIETPVPWLDAIRLGLIFVPAIIVLAMALVVLWKYMRVFCLDQKLAKRQGVKSSWRGLLPLHVAAVAFSYGGLIVMLLTNLVERFREPLYSMPRTLVYSALLWVGVFALWSITSHSKRRCVAIERVAYPGAFHSESKIGDPTDGD